MAGASFVAIFRTLSGKLKDLIGQAQRRWLAEFFELLPERISDRLAGNGRKSLAIAIEGEDVLFELAARGRRQLASGRIRLSDYSPAFIERFIESHGVARSNVALGLRMPAAQVFARKIVLPREAAGAIDGIAKQDLARRTPFRLTDVFCGHSVKYDPQGKKVVVQQWIVRCNLVQALLTKLQLDLGAVAFVETTPQSNSDAAFISLQTTEPRRHSWERRLMVALSYSAVVLAMLAGTAVYWRQQATIDRLDAQIAAAKLKAQVVRTAIDKLEQRQATIARVRSQKSAPGLVDLIEEASRILPTHTWLTEFRLSQPPGSGRQVLTMVGLSSGAPALVSLVDASPMFGDTSLTAPVTTDPVEGRERFALQARVKIEQAGGSMP